MAKLKRERLRSAIVAPDYVPLGGAVDLANLESRLKPEGGLQQQSADGNESGSDEDHRMTFVGGRGQIQADRSLAEEPQVHIIPASRIFNPNHPLRNETL